MGKKTGISWCDHTFNPWIGCQKVSAGCLNCYAARDNNRYKWVDEWGKDYRVTSEANWLKPIQWAKKAVKDGVIRRVFCASLADVFDINVSKMWRDRLWVLIQYTERIGGLEWLLLTKRPENIQAMGFPQLYEMKNVRIGITCENQEMAENRIPILLDAWKGKNFISYEPAIGSIKFSRVPGLNSITKGPQLQWIIAGCESGANARPCDIEWIRSVRDQCQGAGVPFFLKQMNVPIGGIDEPYKGMELVKEPVLDGRQWLEFPRN